MSGRRLASTGVLAIVIAVVSLAPAPAAGQAQTARADTSTPHRTPWGDPDLQGIWDYRTFTPFERPRELAGKEFFATEEEAAEFEQRTAQRRDNAPFTVQDRRIFYDRGTTLTEGRRTSLIVDPRDGRLPPLTPKARERRTAMLAARDHGPENRTWYERCIVANTNGAPLVPAAVYFNHNVQLFQTPEYVVLLNEMIHDARIVPLDGRPHVGPHIRLWMGDSRGRWEGNTLVVDTTNFNDRGLGFGRGGSETHLIERFTRVDANTLLYEFTVDDPATWTTPWSVAVHMTKTKGPIFEYACHEGNYRAMVAILSGARAAETWPTIELRGVDVVDAGAPVSLQADAAAYGGARVERVEFVVDGVVVGVDREAPYEVTWAAGGPGRHPVTATVHDSERRVASAPATVFVGVRALERSIGRSEDDGGEGPSGSVNLTSDDLDLGDEPVALRFTEIRIPRDARIERAYVQFTARNLDSEPTDLIIQAELAGNGVALRPVTNDLSSRTRTSASVSWSPEPWEVAGERAVRQSSPDLAALIQEVVDRPDWHEGNALVLLISGSGGERGAWSYDGAARSLEHAPRLYIELADVNP